MEIVKKVFEGQTRKNYQNFAYLDVLSIFFQKLPEKRLKLVEFPCTAKNCFFTFKAS